MADCGKPGMCGRNPDCSDHHCPGRGTDPTSWVDDDMWIGHAFVLIAIIFVIFVSGFIDALSIYLSNN